MSETYEANLSLFPGGARVADVGFRFGAKGTHTSRTMMFEELRQALLATAPEARRGDYASPSPPARRADFLINGWANFTGSTPRFLSSGFSVGFGTSIPAAGHYSPYWPRLPEIPSSRPRVPPSSFYPPMPTFSATP
jgi:hypothetical protein